MISIRSNNDEPAAQTAEPVPVEETAGADDVSTVPSRAYVRDNKLAEKSPLLKRLSPRQQDVALQMTRGNSDKEIARNTGLSISTVKVHQKAIRARFGVSTRLEVSILLFMTALEATGEAREQRRPSGPACDSIDMVREFHIAFELWDHTRESVGMPSHKVRLGRVQGLTEEVAELALALGNDDMVKTLDALCDIQYFLDGTFIALGLDGVKDEAFAEVHRSNMTKLFKGKPVRDVSGRVQKGPDYEPPELGDVLVKRLTR